MAASLRTPGHALDSGCDRTKQLDGGTLPRPTPNIPPHELTCPCLSLPGFWLGLEMWREGLGLGVLEGG